MVIKPDSKKTTTNKPVSNETAPKTRNVKTTSSNVDLQKVIDLQAKQIQKMEKMILSLDEEVKEIRKQISADVKVAAASYTSKAKSAAKTTTRTAKAASKSVLEGLVEIPQEISDRINALTSQKIVTQTQLGKETELSQKKIHEIASRKVKDLNQDVINRLNTVIKKYETK